MTEGRAAHRVMAEGPKTFITHCWWKHVLWSFPTVVSLAATAILFWLNFTKHAIGGEIGGTVHSTSNILGALQFVVKFHELFIVASLVAIARQLILSNFINGGIVLGLLGAENSLADPMFVFSEEYIGALIYGWSSFFPGDKDNHPVRRKVFGLALFILLACTVASLAGPSSGVLMIPQVRWNFFGRKTYSLPMTEATFPNVMIGTMGNGQGNVFEQDPLFYPGLSYWNYYFDNSAANASLATADELEHQFADAGTTSFINTTGPPDRDLEGKWDGGTRVTCEMRGVGDDSSKIIQNARASLKLKDISKGWRSLQTTINLTGMTGLVTCRARNKILCHTGAISSKNLTDPNWCYMSVGELNTTGVIRSSRNLLLAADYAPQGGYYQYDTNSRVWITEGPPIAANIDYSDSIEIIFEAKSSDFTDFNLTVCTFAASLVSGVGTAFGQRTTAQKIEYFNYAIRQNGTSAPPRKLLFHKNWLDRAYSIDWDRIDLSSNGSIPPETFSYPPRPGIMPPGRSVLGLLGNTTRWAGDQYNGTQALHTEVVVGGSLAYLLSWITPSDSQYTMPFEEIPQQFKLGPPESWVTTYVYNVYREGFSYRLSTRTGILGVVVLAIHALMALVASMWHLATIKKGIILGWRNTPEYMMLGAGSSTLTEEYPNTCAGIGGKNALRGLIMIRDEVGSDITQPTPPPPPSPPSPPSPSPSPNLETVTNDSTGEKVGHLEIVTKDSTGKKVARKGQGPKYGFRARREGQI